MNDSSAHLAPRRLAVLAALADQGTLTAAARSLRISQPAASQSLKDLERDVGAPLATRQGRRLTLTPAGRLLADYGRRMARLGQEAESAVRELMGLKRGRLAIGASTTPGTYLLPRHMGRFHARYPDIALELRIGDTREVESWVLKGEVDFGVIGETREQLGLTVRPFRRDELVLVAPRRHPLAKRRRIDAEALAAHPLILREEGSSTRETLERALAARGVVARTLFALGSTEAILAAVGAGLGASVVSSLAVESRAARSGLIVRHVAGLDLSRFLAVAVHPDAKPGPAAEQFMSRLIGERGQA